jgi:phage terminase large subunit-like protein
MLEISCQLKWLGWTIGRVRHGDETEESAGVAQAVSGGARRDRQWPAGGASGGGMQEHRRRADAMVWAMTELMLGRPRGAPRIRRL